MKAGWDDNNVALQLFEIQGIPFVAILDQAGKIVYRGHPSEGNIETTINNLLATNAQ